MFTSVFQCAASKCTCHMKLKGKLVQLNLCQGIRDGVINV